MIDLSTLNKEQRHAVETTEGAVLILAGAGSGKTRALTHRIAYLIEKGVAPWSILALTFTNKAAREMRERIDELAGRGGDDVWVSTFHSCCAKILRIDIEKMGFTRDFVIYDDSDQLSLIVEIQKQMNLKEEEWPKRSLRAVFSEAKNRSVRPEEYLREASGMRADTYLAAYRLYEKRLRENNALDFDDLLLRTLELFETCPAVLEKYQEKFRYIHVDEYQDTNMAQYRFVRLLAKKHGNICVVGDDDQSIYGWRGADIRNILEFEKDYPSTTVLRLEQNYRSTGYILDAANAVISRNTERKPKKLWTDRGKGEKITQYNAWSERDEADYVCRVINAEVMKGASCGNFAVLYRTNGQSRVLEETFTSYGIPYVVYGSLRFYDRAEIKDVLAYLRLMVNPRDEVSLARIINTPKRGIGEAAITELRQAAEQAGMNLLDACLQAEALPISGRVLNRIKPFGELMAQFRALSELMPLSEFTEQMLDMIGYWRYLEEAKKADGKQEERRENVREFLGAIAEFEKTVEENALSAFLENVSLVANVSDEGNDGAVTLMTMHSAKGLEFPTVFVCGMEEGLFPTARAIMNPAGMEEERRLCYVAITRAMKKLYLLRAESRMLYNEVVRHKESRFLSEIPSELFEGMEPAQNHSDGQWKSASSGSFGGNGRGQEGFGHESYNSYSGGPRTPVRDLSPHGTPAGGSFAPAPRKPKQQYAFTVYQRVRHAKFGEGEIIQMENGVLTIDFDSCGVKKIVAAYAPVEPAEV